MFEQSTRAIKTRINELARTAQSNHDARKSARNQLNELAEIAKSEGRNNKLAETRLFDLVREETRRMVAGRILGKTKDALIEDATTDATITAITKFPEFDPIKSAFTTWHYNHVMEAVRSISKQASRHTTTSLEQPIPGTNGLLYADAIPNQNPQTQEPELDLRTLDKRGKLILNRLREGYRHREIAAELEISPSRESVLYRRALRKFKPKPTQPKPTTLIELNEIQPPNVIQIPNPSIKPEDWTRLALGQK